MRARTGRAPAPYGSARRCRCPGRPRAVVQVAARGRCVLRVNGQVVGRQGGFDPYAEHAVPRVRRHDVAAALRAGDNEIVVESAGGDELAVLVDAVCHDDASALFATAHSDATWWAERDGERVPSVVRRAPAGDPSALHLRRRPHPLPGAAWLDPDADDGSVVSVGFAVPGGRPSVEWLWCELPPGATRLTVEVHGGATVFVDGEERGSTAGGAGPHTLTVHLAGGEAPRAYAAPLCGWSRTRATKAGPPSPGRCAARSASAGSGSATGSPAASPSTAAASATAAPCTYRPTPRAARSPSTSAACAAPRRCPSTASPPAYGSAPLTSSTCPQ